MCHHNLAKESTLNRVQSLNPAAILQKTQRTEEHIELYVVFAFRHIYTLINSTVQTAGVFNRLIVKQRK